MSIYSFLWKRPQGECAWVGTASRDASATFAGRPSGRERGWPNCPLRAPDLRRDGPRARGDGGAAGGAGRPERETPVRLLRLSAPRPRRSVFPAGPSPTAADPWSARVHWRGGRRTPGGSGRWREPDVEGRTGRERRRVGERAGRKRRVTVSRLRARRRRRCRLP